MKELTEESLDELLLVNCQNSPGFVGAIVIDCDERCAELYKELERHKQFGITPNIECMEEIMDVPNLRSYRRVLFKNGSVIMIITPSDNIARLQANKILYWGEIPKGLIRYLQFCEHPYVRCEELYAFGNYGEAIPKAIAIIDSYEQDKGGVLDNFLESFVINKL